ncbi:MAG: transketolase C-terminal domain-containing protein [Ignavibacteria bacterium]|nr:transketolase C-terminal domain-containing protein [Ignavibacteria bacterium]
MTYEDALKEIVIGDETYIILTAESRTHISNLPLLLGERFIDTGITEQTLVGTACGFALRGRNAVAHGFAAFLTMRAFEFIRTDIGVGKLPVKLVGFSPGFLSTANGPAHQALEDVSLMRGIPNMNVFCPADEEDLSICLRKILESQEAFYIRFNDEAPVYKHSEDFEIGKAEVISEGKDITILVNGYLFNQALKAKEILEGMGMSIGLINVRTPKPFDEALVLETAEKTKLIVTLEDHFLTGGLYSITAELFVKNKIHTPVLPIALENNWFKPALINDVLEHEGFTGEQIANRITDYIKRS